MTTLLSFTIELIKFSKLDILSNYISTNINYEYTLITLTLKRIPINTKFIVINHRNYKLERCESGLISTLGKRV